MCVWCRLACSHTAPFIYPHIESKVFFCIFWLSGDRVNSQSESHTFFLLSLLVKSLIIKQKNSPEVVLILPLVWLNKESVKNRENSQAAPGAEESLQDLMLWRWQADETLEKEKLTRTKKKSKISLFSIFLWILNSKWQHAGVHMPVLIHVSGKHHLKRACLHLYIPKKWCSVKKLWTRGHQNFHDTEYKE